MAGSAGDALDILANAVSRLEEIDKTTRTPVQMSEHRVSCHRCGNIRKKKLCCPRHDCPHIFCGRCADKLRIEHGEDVFLGGCPVCKELCCCSNKTIYCDRKNHCYRKCPSTKSKHFNNNNSSSNMTSTPSSDSIQSAMTGRDSQWDQDAKNCRAPALDFLASIVTNTGPESAPAAASSIGIHGSFGGENGLSIRKSDSVKSLASQSSMTSSTESRSAAPDGDTINVNGKRTPRESPAPDAKQLKVENGPSSGVPISEAKNATGGQSAVFSNLPMPSSQIPSMNNNGQFNQSFLLDQAAGGQLAEPNAQSFVMPNQLPVAGEGQKLREDMQQLPYYFTDMQGSTEQQTLVYPVSNFAANAGSGSVENRPEGEAEAVAT